MSLDGFQPQNGNRNTLSRDEMDLLDETILPTARRWVRDVPSLADHGRQTLAYWGETPPPSRPKTFGGDA